MSLTNTDGLLQGDRREVRYYHEDDAWWGESNNPQWTGQASTLDELRLRAAEGLRFAVSRGETIEPPARSLLFVHWQCNVPGVVWPDARETFVIDPPNPPHSGNR